MISSIISTIDTINEELDKSKIVIFADKCQITASILNEIKNIAEQKKFLDVSQEDLIKLNELLNNILKVFRFLKNEKEVHNFLISTKPIQQPVTEINDYMKQIIEILDKYKLLEVFKLPQEHLYFDIVHIADLLSNPKYQNIESIQERKNQIAEYIKKNQKPEEDEDLISNDEDNFAILNKFPKYKLSQSDYTRGKPYFENDLFTLYYGEKNSEEREKLRIMRLNDKSKLRFKRVFKILTTNHHPYLETFVGANITDSNVEIITLKAGGNLKKLFSTNTEEDETFDDSEKRYVYLEPGDRTIIAFKIALGMAYLHSRGVIHRNLSSSNIYIKKILIDDETDKYEIIPIITNFVHSHLISRNSILGMTNIHTTKSLSSFIAPELTDNPNYNEKVDVFAFSGILYELLTDHSPYEEMGGGNIWSKIKDEHRPNIPDYCSEKLRKLIESCWSQSPTKRPSFEQIINFMLPKDGQEMIIFESDKSNSEPIKKFYQQFIINSSSASECLDIFESIKNNIGYACQYRFEFYRIIPILSHYQYSLREFMSLHDDLNEEENKKMVILNDNLRSLREIVLNVSPNRWFNNALKMEIDETTNKLNQYMENIYQSMKNLGIDVIYKYEENDNDLVFDYRQLLNDFQGTLEEIDLDYISYSDTELEQIKDAIKAILEKKNNIDEFLEKRNLNESKSDEVLKSQTRDLFSQFSSFELDENNFIQSKSISEGVTSVVYQGLDKQQDKEVAIKVLNEGHLRSGEKALILLSREIGILTSLQHDYIAKFIGYCIPKDGVSVWLISELYSSGSLFELKDGLQGLHKTQIAFEIAEAMEYIHSKRILHRDLKSSNILIDDDGHPRIIDFGFSRSDIKNLSKTTKTGTYNYMAPEVANGSNYSSEADVFSFGMLLWEIENEMVPYANLSEDQVQYNARKCEKLKFKKNCPEELKKLILLCRSKDPKDRPTFSDIIEIMINKNIMFSDLPFDYDDQANRSSDSVTDYVDQVKQFYEEKAIKREKLRL